MQHHAASQPTPSERYARVIDLSRRVRWEIERDVIRGRRFDFTKKFLPDGLSKVGELAFLSEPERRLVSQVQGRSYANIFGLVERFIAAKVMDLGRAHAFGDQTAFEAMVRMTDEEVKHQELFRRLEAMMAAAMPAGYELTADPNAVARAVLAQGDALKARGALVYTIGLGNEIDADLLGLVATSPVMAARRASSPRSPPPAGRG